MSLNSSLFPGAVTGERRGFPQAQSQGCSALPSVQKDGTLHHAILVKARVVGGRQAECGEMGRISVYLSFKSAPSPSSPSSGLTPSPPPTSPPSLLLGSSPTPFHPPCNGGPKDLSKGHTCAPPYLLKMLSWLPRPIRRIPQCDPSCLPGLTAHLINYLMTPDAFTCLQTCAQTPSLPLSPTCIFPLPRRPP